MKNVGVVTWKSQQIQFRVNTVHDDVIKRKYFPCYWPFMRGIHRSPVNSPHEGQWRGALMLSLICAWTAGQMKPSWRQWFETQLCSSWRDCNVCLCGVLKSCGFASRFFKNIFSSLLYDANVVFNALHLSSETILQVVYIKFPCPGLAFGSSQPRPSTVLYDYYLCIRITAVTGGHVSQQGASQVNTGDRKHFMTRVRCVQTTTLPLDRKQSQSDPGQYRPRAANRIPGWPDLIVPRLTLPSLVYRHRWTGPSYWLVDLIVSHFNYSRSGKLTGTYCGFNYGLATMC